MAELYWSFAVTSVVVLIIPGPAVVCLTAETLSGGQRTGLGTAVGLSAGAVVHVAVACAGLGWILSASPTALTTIRAVGALCLIGIGVATLLGGRWTELVPTRPVSHRFSAGLKGAVVSLTNPESLVFLIGFLPQFVHPDYGHPQLQLLLLGLLFTTGGLFKNLALVLLIVRVGSFSRSAVSRRHSVWAGGAYLLLGVVALAWR